LSVRDQIMKEGRLARMRLGQAVCEFAEIPSMSGVRVALVPLTEAEMTNSLMYAAMSNGVPEDGVGMQYRMRRAADYDLWQAIREPEDLTEKVFESVEAMMDELDPNDIDVLNMTFTAVLNNSSPRLDNLSEEDIDFLEGLLRTTSLNDLSGKQWGAASVFLSICYPGQLQARLSGTSSTSSLTTTNGEPEPTSSVSPS
jgi:hypothetical protein